jgi:uncharacterized protein YlaI
MLRLPALTKLARDESCVMCEAQDGTIVWAHSNLGEHGKGKSLKAHDPMGAFLCYRCHSELDQGAKMSRAERRDFTLTAICRTHLRLWQQGKVGIL